MVFNWSNITTDTPKITDVLNISDWPPNILQVFTYTWVWFLGGWFFAAVFGIIAGALYMKSQNALIPIVFLILMTAFYGGVLQATPSMGTLPEASAFVGLIGLLAAFTIGFLIYRLFRSK